MKKRRPLYKNGMTSRQAKENIASKGTSIDYYKASEYGIEGLRESQMLKRKMCCIEKG